MKSYGHMEEPRRKAEGRKLRETQVPTVKGWRKKSQGKTGKCPNMGKIRKITGLEDPGTSPDSLTH